jgi:hypothetical protein
MESPCLAGDLGRDEAPDFAAHPESSVEVGVDEVRAPGHGEWPDTSRTAARPSPVRERFLRRLLVTAALLFGVWLLFAVWAAPAGADEPAVAEASACDVAVPSADDTVTWTAGLVAPAECLTSSEAPPSPAEASGGPVPEDPLSPSMPAPDQPPDVVDEQDGQLTVVDPADGAATDTGSTPPPPTGGTPTGTTPPEGPSADPTTSGVPETTSTDAAPADAIVPDATVTGTTSTEDVAVELAAPAEVPPPAADPIPVGPPMAPAPPVVQCPPDSEPSDMLRSGRPGSAATGHDPAPASRTTVEAAIPSAGPTVAPVSTPDDAPVPVPPPSLPAPLPPTTPVGPTAAAGHGGQGCGPGQTAHDDGVYAALDDGLAALLLGASAAESVGHPGAVVGGVDDPGARPG